ncbi:hypothetical protein BGW39_005893, partial [Mortierella sp. 14UC]
NSHMANQDPHTDESNSNNTQLTKKQNKLRGFFGLSKSKADVKTKDIVSSTHTSSNKHLVSVIDSKEDKPLPPPPLEEAQPVTTIFPTNVSRPAIRTKLPRLSERIERADQLVYCNALLLQSSSTTTTDKQDLQEQTLDKTELDWLAEVQKNPMERDHIHWLAARMVEEFIEATTRDSTEIAEIVALGPVLDREHYRKLLSSFIKDFDGVRILDVDLLQGLVQLIQAASPGYLEPDDLVKILSIIRVRLEGTHQQSTEYSFHLILAVSRILDMMADHKVQDLDRVLEHEPLAGLLSGLKGTSDPYVLYQACYAFQALQYVPNDETPLQAVLRHSADVANGLVKVSAVFKLDLASVLEGIENLQESAGITFEVAKIVYEGTCSVMESGQGVFESLKDMYGSGKKRPWYFAVRAANALAQAGQLRDLNILIIEAPCRRDPLFQWGICQLLGEVASNAIWDAPIRQQAIDLLGDLYRDDTDWGNDESVKTWMLNIIGQLAVNADQDINTRARSLLDNLKQDQGAPSKLPYLLSCCLPIPGTSPTLAKVHGIPFIEYDLFKLRLQRLEEGKQSIYIPPMAKASLQARDDDVFLLIDKVQEFLASERQVMLVLGDSGAGKSTFNKHLESELLRVYKSGGAIPLFINLPAIDEPDKDMVEKQLKEHNFSEDKIRELKLHRRFVLICDGYDESQQLVNLYRTNMLNQSGQWKAKMIISCRSQYLGQDYRSRFMPQSGGHYSRPSPELFQEAVIAPFSKEQIKSYIDQYVPLEPRNWSTQDYMEKLTLIPHLMDLVKNPFLLTLALEALPAVTEGKKDLEDIEITRIQLYDIFVEHWLEVNKRRLESNTLTDQDRSILDQLLDAGFTYMGIDYSTRLASAIFEKQDGNPVVQYVQLKDKDTWRDEFFGPKPEVRLLRESSPLNRTGSLFRFIHRSVQEYFFSRTIFVPSTRRDPGEFAPQLEPGPVDVDSLDPDGPLFTTNLLKEPAVIQFLCERVQKHPNFRSKLLTVIEQSKIDATAATAATNAITILVRAGVSFHGANLQGIRIPGADLTGGQFDSAQLQGANLTNVNFTASWLRQVDVSRAQLSGVRFGELPYLKHFKAVFVATYSPDGTRLAVAQEGAIISIYDTATWMSTHQLDLRRSRVLCIEFSPDSQQIAFGDNNAVQLWNFASGKPMLYSDCMNGHTNFVRSVAYSPCGKHLVSASRDQKLIIWSVETKQALFTLRDHTDDIVSVKYSPDGRQIVSGSMDGTVRFWDAATGEPGVVWTSSQVPVWSLAYSPDGQKVAVGYRDSKIQLWNTSTGVSSATLVGHTQVVTSLAFSPNGLWLASSSGDQTVKLWDVSAGTLVSTFPGGAYGVKDVAFSMDGQQLASGGEDGTVRLWDVNSNELSIVGPLSLSGIRPSVSYSFDGRAIFSARDDGTLQQWDARTGTPGANSVISSKKLEMFAQSSDGTRFVLSHYGSISLWNCQTGKAGPCLPGHVKTITELAYSPCGRWVVAASDKAAQLWDLQDIQEEHLVLDLKDIDGAYISSVAFSPAGAPQLAIADSTGRVHLYDPSRGRVVKETRIKETRAGTMAYSPNGQQLVMGSDGGVVYMWDVLSDEPGVKMNERKGKVRCLAYSPCGQWIIIAYHDKTVRLYQNQPASDGEGEQVESWTCAVVVSSFFNWVQSVAWSPTVPLEFVTSGYDQSVRVWRILVKDDGSVCVAMVWGSNLGQLCASDLTFKDAVGLDVINQRLLVQRGAIEQPSSLAV